MNREPPRLGDGTGRFGARPPGLFTKILAGIVGLALLGVAVAASLVIFAVALAGLLVFGLYVWWKTRDIRRQMRNRFPDDNVRTDDVIQGEVIEGEVIRKTRAVDPSESNARPDTDSR